MQAFGEWVLRRGLKQVLKRNLANLLATEIDTEQLGVQLEKGSLELKDCLLDTDYLNERWGQGTGIQFKSVLVGRVEVTLYPLQILFEDVDICLGQLAGSGGSGPQRSVDQTFEAEQSTANADAIGESVSFITSCLESMLRRVHVESRRLVVRLDLTGGHVVAVNLDSSIFLGLPGTENNDTETQNSVDDLGKTFAFDGLAIQISAPHDEGAVVVASLSGRVGCHGAVAVGWSARDGGDLLQEPSLAVSIELGGLHAKVAPTAVTPLFQLAEIVAARRYQGSSPTATNKGAGNAFLTRSLMLVRDMEATVIDSLRLPLEDGDEEEIDEFHDAVSDISTASHASIMRAIETEGSIFKDQEMENDKGRVEDVVVKISSFSLAFIYQEDAEISDAYLYLFCAGALLSHKGRGISGKETIISFENVEITEHLPGDHRDDSGQVSRSASACVELSSALRSHRGGTLADLEGQEGRSPFAETLAQLDLLRDTEVLSGQGTGKVLPVLSCTSPKKAVAIQLRHEDSGFVGWTLLSREIMIWIDAPLLKRLVSLVQSLDNGKMDGAFSLEEKFARSFPELHVNIPSIGLVAFLPERIVNSSGLVVPSVLGCIAAPTQAALQVIDSLDNGTISGTPLFRCAPSAILTTGAVSVNIWLQIEDDYGPTLQHVVGLSSFQVEAHCNAIHSRVKIPGDVARVLPGSEALPALAILFLGESRIALCSPELVTLRSLPLASFCPFDLSDLNGSDEDSTSFVTMENLTVSVADSIGEFSEGVTITCSLDIGHRSTTTACSLSKVTIAVSGGRPLAANTLTSVITQSQVSSKSQVDIDLQGLIVEDDFLSSAPLLHQVISFLPSSPSSDEPSAEVNISFKDIAVFHRPAQINQEAHVLMALLLQTASCTLGGPLIEGKLHDLYSFLKIGDLEELGIRPINLEYLTGNGFVLLAHETCLSVQRFQNDVGTERIVVRSDCLEISLDKRTAMHLQTILEQMPRASVTSAETFQLRTGGIDDALQWELTDSEFGDEDLFEDGWYDVATPSGTEVVCDKRSVSNGDGVWYGQLRTLAELYISDHVTPPPEPISIEGVDFANMLPGTPEESTPPIRQFTFSWRSVSVVLDDALTIPEFEIVRGRLEASFKKCVCEVSEYADVTVKWLITAGLGSVHAQHCFSTASSSGEWRDCIISPHLGRGGGSAARLVCQGVEPVAGANIEWRLHLNMASTRLHLDQLGLLFVPEFFSHANSKCPVEQSKAFIQRCQVDTILITVSYKPARVDLKALLSTRKESLLEALNLLPELKAPLSLRGFCLRGFEGFESLGSAAAAKWMNDVYRTQLHNFVINLPGVRSVCRVGTAAKGFRTLPQSATRKEFNRQFQKSAINLAKAIADESLRALAGIRARLH